MGVRVLFDYYNNLNNDIDIAVVLNHSIFIKLDHDLFSNTRSNSFSVLAVFTLILLSLTFGVSSLVYTFPSILATSSNSGNGSEESETDSNQFDGNEINGTTISSSDDDQQQQESTINEDSGEYSINDNDQSPTKSQNASPDFSQGLIQQNNNQIQPNTLNGNIGIQEQPRENTDLTSSNLNNTLVPIKPDPNLQNSPGNLKVIMNVECKSINGQPSDKAVCDAYSKDSEFIQPSDYSLTLDITRNGTHSKTTFPGDPEGQRFTITPGEFDVYGELNGDAYTVVSKKGGFSQFNYIDYNPSTERDCENVIQPIAGPVGKLHAEGVIYPLTNITCIITMELEYRYFVLPKSSFGDMLQNQRMPDVVSQN